MFFNFLRLVRSDQWIKNVFVMAGFIFSGKYSDMTLLADCISAMAAFCFASSSIYAFNDCIDAEDDKKNPVKRNRPIASGNISKSAGYFFSSALAVISLVMAFFISIKIFIMILAYIILNIAYSLHLKKIVIIDVFCISMGFMLRLASGTYGVGIPPSHWIIICTMMLSLFLGWSKRYAELSINSDSARTVLKNYSVNFLEMLLGITSSCTILTYGLYTISPVTIAQHRTENLIFSLPLVIFGLFRYLYLVISQKKGEDPAREIFSDQQLFLTVIAYASVILIIIFQTRR